MSIVTTRARISAASVLAVVVLVAGAGAALAAPANDDISAAIDIAGSQVASMNTSGATTEAGEPVPSCQADTGASVWYRLSPATAIRFNAKTFGSKFDTVLAVYRGTPGSLTEIACNDDAEDVGSQQSSLATTAASGETLYVQVGGYAGAAGLLKITFTVAERFIGDAFADAVQITALPFTDSADTSVATSEPGEPYACTAPSHSWWYAFTPAATTRVSATTAGSTYDTVLALWSGTSLDALEFIDCNDDGGTDLTSRLNATLVGGQQYYFQIDDLNGSGGPTVFSLETPAPPANDDFANATAVAVPAFVDDGSTLAATTEPDEPSACGIDTATAWYRVRLGQTTPLVLRAVSDDWNFYPAVAVYTGAELGSLSETSCGYYETGFVALADTDYFVQLGGTFGESGPFRFDIATGVTARAPFTGVTVATDGNQRHRALAYSFPLVAGAGALVEQDESGTQYVACAYAILIYDCYGGDTAGSAKGQTAPVPLKP